MAQRTPYSDRVPCPFCGHKKTHSRGRGQFYCPNPTCGKYFTGKLVKGGHESHTEISLTVNKLMNDGELLDYLNLDPTLWQVDKVTYTIKDSGKLNSAPVFSVRGNISQRGQENAVRKLAAELLEDAQKFTPKYPKVKYPKYKGGLLFEIGMPDIHLGLLAWSEESGVDSDIKLTEAMVNKVIDRLLGFSQNMSVSRILLPIGNDYFNVNDKREETIHGTRQQEDTRWQKTFRKGCEILINVIDKCAAVAPVDVVVIPGNHDEERAFYLGEVLSGWYRNCPNVTVDNRAVKRKYYPFGANLIGLTHGYYEKINRLESLMALEAPQLWAASRYREWHLGDKHHKVDMVKVTEELTGVTVRILRALSAPSTWAFDKGYVGALRAAEGFMWHPEHGLIAQFTAAADL